MTMRRPLKFEDVAGAISYTFSTKSLEMQEEIQLRVAFTSGVGADYSHDHHGYGIPPKGNRLINVRAMLVESTPSALADEMDEARAECYRIGLGYLYRIEADGSTQRRCLARVNAIPSITINNLNRFGAAPIAIQFVALSDWMATVATTGSQTIDTPLESVTVNNPGNMPVTDIVWRLRNNGLTRAVRPTLFNATTGQYAAFLRTMGAANDELYLDSGSRLVRWSENDGSSYTNDYSNFAGSFFRLDPGNNTVRVLCGRTHIVPVLRPVSTPNFGLEWSFYARYM